MRKVFRNTKKSDIIFLVLNYLYILFVVYLITGNQYIFGSSVDWVNQHSVLPNYFRQYFYETGKFIPEYCLQLGSGENSFNFAYYGLLNPIVLISYLMPAVSMENYIVVSSVVIVLVSLTLFMFWLKSIGESDKKIRPEIIYVATFMFSCASPLLYHSHKQIMFMSYMPFMILALWGVDRFFKGKRCLLIISVACMFFTSYYFAVSGVFALVLYGVYRYLETYKKIQVKTFLREGVMFAVCNITGILLAGIILIPSFAAILAGRSDKVDKKISLLELFLPNFPKQEILYSSYGIGLSAFALIAIIAFSFVIKDKAKRFLSIGMLLVICLPFCRFILNGGLYTRSKILIPFLPIAVLVAAFFLESLIRGEVEKRKLLVIEGVIVISGWVTAIFGDGRDVVAAFTVDVVIVTAAIFAMLRYNKKRILYGILIVMAAGICIVANLTDELVEVKSFEQIHSKEKKEIINEVLGVEDGLYRTNDICQTKSTNNIIYNKNFYSTGAYSSLFNRDYVKFCNYDLNLANPTVNDISITASKDVFFQTLMGVKYMISDTSVPAGYSLIHDRNNYGVYKNDNVYSIGFATKTAMSLREYKSLAPEERELALLQYVVMDRELPNVYENLLEKVDLKLDFGFELMEDGYYHALNTEEGTKTFTINTPDDLKDYVYILKCHIKEYSKKRATIRINGIQNSLSGLDAAYPNSNFDFKFVISEAESSHTIRISFPEDSDFRYTDFEVYRVKYSDVVALKDDVVMMENIEYDNDNVIQGDIFLEEDRYFTTTIPYDENFVMYVDGKQVKYEKTANAFIGCELPAGNHHIELVYSTAMLKEGKLCTFTGIMILMVIFVYDRISNRRKKELIQKEAAL